jgi:O-antigen/teichoic acid export membrane protein
MGFMISLSGLITLGASYIVRIFINYHGGISNVGLYNAGFAIISTYVGLVFMAMGTDYYPRLSAVAHSNALCRATINQQAEIALLIIAPIILIFLVFIHWIVVLLYSNKFVAVNDMILLTSLGMLFRTGSFAIAFIFLAKGASKLYFWNELIANVYILGLNIACYYWMGLTGLGISFLIGYVLYFIQVFILSKFKYDFSFDKAFICIFATQLVLAVSCFLVVKLLPANVAYGIGSVFIVISGWYSWRELDKRMDLKEFASRFKN